MATRSRTAEHDRLATVAHPESDLTTASDWYEWGPYLAERAWGSVREDYSEAGDAWSSFPHDHARSRAYRWNEDGLAGLSDVRQRLCFALALWNGRDPILKERIFGLTGPEGNHGEDAKEYWWYLDALPSHAWLRWRYVYPQTVFPYDLLVAENGRRGFHDPEFELLDTGVFDDDRYWAIDVTYAKATPVDILMRIEVKNHGPEADELHVLPTLWFRNRWSWDGGATTRPVMRLGRGGVRAEVDPETTYVFSATDGPAGSPIPLFCENETNTVRLYGHESSTDFPKDGINDHVVRGAPTVNPDAVGTKAAWWYRMVVEPGDEVELRLRLRRVDSSGDDSDVAPRTADAAARSFAQVMDQRQREADEYYASLIPGSMDEERARVVRQACAGLVWTKQYYPYRVARWLEGDPGQPAPSPARLNGRNAGWRHLDADDVLAMPDAWEYPWFAAWDLAFHAIAWAHLDPAFAKYQLLVLLREWFLNPNGALPAYEWSFDDVNPPVHAFAALRVFHVAGDDDVDFLERSFHKLLLNYAWWLNRQDPDGNNLFAGGFLGLDNISPIDRSHLRGATLVQADGSAWMAFNSLAMLTIAVLLAERTDIYDDMVVTFLERFVSITRAINSSGMYDPTRGFFYDFVETHDGRQRVEVETIGGAVPLFSAVALHGMEDGRRRQALRRRLRRLLDVESADARDLEALGRLRLEGGAAELLVSVVSPEQLRTTLEELFDESSFLSPYGLRSLSKRYDGRPYTITLDGASYAVDYEPAESTTPMYGGNSNWRGPIWLPMNYLVIRSLVRFHQYVGPEFTVEYPSRSGQHHNLLEIAQDLADRVMSIFLRNADGRRPVFGGTERFQRDPAWDNLLFYEYFHGDNGAGLGASHQTGWTALVIDLLLDPPLQSVLPDIGLRSASER